MKIIKYYSHVSGDEAMSSGSLYIVHPTYLYATTKIATRKCDIQSTHGRIQDSGELVPSIFIPDKPGHS